MVDMTNENAMQEKISYFLENKIKVHITLNKIMPNGKHSWLRGIFTEKLTDNLFILKESVLGEIRITTFEIEDIQEYKSGVGDGTRTN